MVMRLPGIGLEMMTLLRICNCRRNMLEREIGVNRLVKKAVVLVLLTFLKNPSCSCDAMLVRTACYICAANEEGDAMLVWTTCYMCC